MTKTRIRRALVAAVTIPVLAASPCSGPGEMSGMNHGSSPAPASSASGADRSAVNPADLMFVVMMIPHHEQAVQLSDLLLAKSGVDPDVRNLAEQIKKAQQPEIETMQGWLEDWGVDGSSMDGMDHSGHMGGMLTDEQLDALRKADGPTAQKLYLTGMIAHHRGAVEMADTVLAVSRDPEVRRLADSIVATQQAEITQMQKLLDG